MKLSISFAFTVLLFGLGTADSIHLAFCDDGEAVFTEMIVSSLFATSNHASINLNFQYYSNDGDSFGSMPPASNVALVPAAITNDWLGENEGVFTTGVVARSIIENAGSNVGTSAGTANNGFKTFNCFQDNNRLLYLFNAAASDSAGCYSQYYCLACFSPRFINDS